MLPSIPPLGVWWGRAASPVAHWGNVWGILLAPVLFSLWGMCVSVPLFPGCRDLRWQPAHLWFSRGKGAHTVPGWIPAASVLLLLSRWTHPARRGCSSVCNYIEILLYLWTCHLFACHRWKHVHRKPAVQLPQGTCYLSQVPLVQHWGWHPCLVSLQSYSHKCQLSAMLSSWANVERNPCLHRHCKSEKGQAWQPCRQEWRGDKYSVCLTCSHTFLPTWKRHTYFSPREADPPQRVISVFLPLFIPGDGT